MSIYYPTDCVDEVVEHFCSDCETPENGWIRSTFFKRKDYTFADIEDAAEWRAAIANGDVIVIPSTHGTADGGTPTYGPGFGSKIQTYVSSTYKVNYFDPNYKKNRDFYQSLKNSSLYQFGYVTSSLVHLSDATCVVAPKNPVEDSLTSQVLWQVEVSWISANEVTITDKPDGIFEVCVLVD